MLSYKQSFRLESLKLGSMYIGNIKIFTFETILVWKHHFEFGTWIGYWKPKLIYWKRGIWKNKMIMQIIRLSSGNFGSPIKHSVLNETYGPKNERLTGSWKDR